MRAEGDCVIVSGTVNHLQNEDLLHEDGVQAHLIAGLTLTKIGDGQHDGAPARIFTLADELGDREVGRLVVRTDAGLEETGAKEEFEWIELCESPEQATARVAEWSKARTNPVATVTVDFAWDGYPSLEIGLASVAAEYGVSLKVVTERGPGGGWPEIEVTGLRENVRRLLKKGWQYPDDMIADDLS